MPPKPKDPTAGMTPRQLGRHLQQQIDAKRAEERTGERYKSLMRLQPPSAVKFDHSQPSSTNQHRGAATAGRTIGPGERGQIETWRATGGANVPGRVGFGMARDIARQQADRLSAQANQLTGAASTTPGSHTRAANAHFDAADAHRDYGNPKMANEHQRLGDTHEAHVVRAENAQLSRRAQHGQIQTSAKGARYYVSSTGEKVYVK